MKNILLCGVGGQGILLAGNVLAEVAMNSGFDVKKSEVHGMAQRGGSVVSHVRFGKNVFSPLIRKGECDLLLAFEQLEALRWAEYLSARGRVLMNRQKILPMSVSAGTGVYPTDIDAVIEKTGKELTAVDAIGEAQKLGNPKCLNVVVLGALGKKLTDTFPKGSWIGVLRERLPAKLLDLNLKAFEAGWDLI
jgi:indolepyruvate ferredoxin oxidoreductase beta subunit